jgi:hypothetical protein
MTSKKISPANGAADLPVLYVIASLAAGLPGGAFAADMPYPQPEPAVASADPITEYFLHWFDRAEEAQATQPHWMTPITTVTPRLEQEYRYDQSQQFLQNGAEVNNYFSGKGLELIPTTTNEILINVPNFEQRLPEGSKVTPATGFADGNFVTIKQRLLSANEENETIFSLLFWDFRRQPALPPLPTGRLGLSPPPSRVASAGVILISRERLAIRSRLTSGTTSARHSSAA